MRRIKTPVAWRLRALLTAFSLLPSLASAQDDAASSAAACPGAAAWQAAHPEEQPQALRERDRQRGLGAPALLEELQRRVDADQQARRQWLDDRTNATLLRSAQAVDADNSAWLAGRLRGPGLPDAAQVGEQGQHLLWLLAQHADDQPRLQAALLAEFERRRAAGEFAAEDLARLTDRVLVNRHTRQRYGTQFDWGSSRYAPARIDASEFAPYAAARAEAGLMPLQDYACLLHAARKAPGQP